MRYKVYNLTLIFIFTSFFQSCIIGMQINYNAIIMEVPVNTKLSDFIHSQLQHHTQGVAVAINNSVVSKINWEHTILKEHDTVLTVKATQGG